MGALAGTAHDMAAHRAVGSARGGVASGGGVGDGGGGAGFAARQLLPSCQAEYACIAAGQMPGVTDQDLCRSKAWLANCRLLTGVMAGLLLLAGCRRPVVVVVAGGSILLGHSMVHKGTRSVTPIASSGG